MPASPSPESAGRISQFDQHGVRVPVSARVTQDCVRCGYREKKDLSQRTHDCPVCGYTVSRDLNAAQNILRKAMVGWGTPESTLAEIGTATPPILVVQVSVDEPRISRL